MTKIIKTCILGGLFSMIETRENGTIKKKYRLFWKWKWGDLGKND